jgi:hypothetical protein
MRSASAPARRPAPAAPEQARQAIPVPPAPKPTGQASEKDLYRYQNWLDVSVPMVDGFEDPGRDGTREIIVVDKLRDESLK